ncbi:iron-containing alcohol dehydrogenase [candidate division KSB1 bacterium]|nr:iron-containing alcohol dehydrogenase [candidate division KSB1 bacterium]
MQNFEYRNPVKIVFGKGTIGKLSDLITKDKKILLAYGGGSIKKNGVYDQVVKALKGYSVVEFAGIEPNPQYDTCMRAVKVVKDEKIDFILSVGGGSVLDAVKFIAAAAKFEGPESWDILTKNAKIKSAVPLGCVLTLPATGSEMNTNAVISRSKTGEKLAFSSEQVSPVFSILDPETTYSLPESQVANGVVDAFVHVMEQYMTYDVNSPVQDRFAEGILKTLIEEGQKVMTDPKNYEVRANIMWAATMALNGLIGQGVPQDWATHMIGHELTALYNIDHARTLAIIMPAVWKHQRQQKGAKLAQYARRVWDVQTSDDNKAIDAAIQKTIDFFRGLDIPTTLGDVDLTPEDCKKAVEQLRNRGSKLGERGIITAKQVEEIFSLAA